MSLITKGLSALQRLLTKGLGLFIRKVIITGVPVGGKAYKKRKVNVYERKEIFNVVGFKYFLLLNVRSFIGYKFYMFVKTITFEGIKHIYNLFSKILRGDKSFIEKNNYNIFYFYKLKKSYNVLKNKLFVDARTLNIFYNKLFDCSSYFNIIALKSYNNSRDFKLLFFKKFLYEDRYNIYATKLFVKNEQIHVKAHRNIDSILRALNII